MVQKFEGHAPAQQEAQMTSKKNNSETWVVKANVGGLKYYVTENANELPQAKVLDHYINGIKQK